MVCTLLRRIRVSTYLAKAMESHTLTCSFFHFTAFTTRVHPRHATALHASNANEIMPMQQGSSCALITPMTDDGKLDIPSLRSLLQFHVEAGTDNLVR